MKKIKIEYVPRPAQKKFHDSKFKFRLYSGAFRAGKTKAGCQESIKLSLMYPKNKGLIGRKDYPDLRDTTQVTFWEELKLYEDSFDISLGDPNFGNSEGIDGYRKMENIFRFKELFGGSEILFRQLKDPEDFKSLNLGWFYLDEGTETTEDMFLMLMSRLSMKHIPYRCGFITTNPDTPSHWIHKRFLDNPTKSYWSVHTTTYDNPHLPEGYVEDLEESFDDDYKNRYLDGKWTVFRGVIYSDFSREINLIEPFKIPKEWTRIRTIDFGYTNPFACLWIALDSDKRMYVYDEYYQPQTLLGQHAKTIKNKTGEDDISYTLCDPSAKQEYIELTNLGISCIPSYNEVSGGIQKIKYRLRLQKDKKPRLVIFNTCRHLMKEFELYKWRVQKGEINEYEEPLKLNDHLLDALRYAVNYIDYGFELGLIGDASNII